MQALLLIVNGPNLNLLGTREPQIYGTATLADVEALCRATASELGWACECRQSNHEGVLIDWIHEAGELMKAGRLAGVVLNAGAYTHTSIALHDAIKGTCIPLAEVHISDIHQREPFRHHSYITPVAKVVVMGKGVAGYAEAIRALAAAT